jgi:hypothetical protein
VPSVEQQIATLEGMSPSELRNRWRETFRTPSPSVSPGVLSRAIAYRVQERAHGGLPRSAAKEIERLTRRLERTGSVVDIREINLKTGTRLVRSWRGKTWNVLVCDDGFQFEDRRYESLSHIAREITGTNWSGPRFFGLKKRKLPPAAGTANG